MEFIPIKTRIMKPPQDDLLAVLDESLTDVREGDVVLISSKVVAIHEGRCLEKSKVNLESLTKIESDLLIERSYWKSPLVVKYHAFLGASGIDESNGNGFYVLLPEDTFASATTIRTWLKEKYKLSELGVVITDSHSVPFRFGATGIALGWAGIEPIEDCRGRKDLFGREINYERSNLVDGLAAGANVLMGEVDECTPVVIARNVPRIKFTEANTKGKLFVDFKEDTFRVLYEKFIDNN